MGNKLKPCPFCGSKDLLEIMIRQPLPDFEEKDGGDWLVRCYGCRSDHLFHKISGEKETKDFWNRRTEDAKRNEN